MVCAGTTGDEQAQLSRPLVTITGVTGFLGSAVAQHFLQDGTYRVRGTVRDKLNAVKIGALQQGLGDLFKDIELVEADILDNASMQKAVEGSTYVVHTASPFVMGVAEDQAEEKLIKPAVEGTKICMEACRNAKVKRAVITSSCAAVFCTDPKDRPADNTWNASHWSNPDRPGGLEPYLKSKTLAEKAAWDFVAALSDEDKFELVAINPHMIMGPTKCSTEFTSGQLLKRMLTGGFNPFPKRQFPVVDVRDVSLAHVQAVKVPEAAGKRFLMVGHTPMFKEIGDVLRDEFAKDGWPVSDQEGEADAVEINNFDTTPAQEILGIKFKPLKETFVEMATCMIEAGVIKK